MNAAAELEIKRDGAGRLFARRYDGERLSSADKKEIARIVAEERALRVNLIAEVVSATGGTLAALIYSSVLDVKVWLVFRAGVVPTLDGLAQYTPADLAALADKTPEQIRAIHRAKLAFPGARVLE